MKKILYTIAILTSICVLGGCSKDDDDINTGKIPPVVNPTDTVPADTVPKDTVPSEEPIEEPEDTIVISETGDFTILKPDSVGTAAMPTDWNVMSNVDLTTFMLLTIDADHMPAEVTSDDLLAAYVGTECRGVVNPKEDVDGVTRFSMIVNQCADAVCDQGQEVTLRYYSAKMKRVFISDKFEYKQGGMLGSATMSYVVNWN